MSCSQFFEELSTINNRFDQVADSRWLLAIECSQAMLMPASWSSAGKLAPATVELL